MSANIYIISYQNYIPDGTHDLCPEYYRSFNAAWTDAKTFASRILQQFQTDYDEQLTIASDKQNRQVNIFSVDGHKLTKWESITIQELTKHN